MMKMVRAPFVLLLLFHAASAAAQSEAPLAPLAPPTREDAAPPAPAPAPTPSLPAPPAPAPPAPPPPAAPSAPSEAARDADEAPSADAPPAPKFATRGQWVLSGGLDASLSHSGYSASEASHTSFGVTPSVDGFVAECFTIGGFASGSVSSDTGYAYGSTLETTTTTSWSLGARFGAVLRLGERISWWPRAGFSYSASNTSASEGSSGRALVDRGANVNAYAPLLVHVAPHAFVGLGPTVTRALSHVQEGYAKTFGNGTVVGASFIVGGWL